jgi:hypothetical protein
MLLSELQRRNLNVKFCLVNPNKSKSETLNYWDSRLPLFIVQIKGLRSKKKWVEKFVPGENVPFHRLKFEMP